MKRVVYLILFISACHNLPAQTGADCASAIPLIFDGVCRTYATSPTLGPSLHCVNNTGNAPVTYFSLTTNSVPDKVLLNITGPGGQGVETVMQPTNCSFNYSSGNLCMDDGNGVWAPSHTFTLPANTTFNLRVRTNIAGNLTICAQYYNPPNDDCAGALAINETYITDNNANDRADAGLSAADLCATTLENTAWYSFTVAATGPSIINLNNINCDNSYGANSNGFQIGFFSGACGALIPITCYAGSGSFVTATTGTLNAGDNIFVAVDGTAGSNCQYQINAINALTLATSMKDFIGWKLDKSNLLNWTVLEEKENTIYEIQRSSDRKNFVTIGQVSAYPGTSAEANHQFEDKTPGYMEYYRLKITEPGNKESYSRIVALKRNKSPFSRVEITNPVSDIMIMRVYSQTKGAYFINVVNSAGQVIFTDKFNCSGGPTTYSHPVASLPSGLYHVVINDRETQFVKTFFKN